jgi:elongator complex protein 5
MALKGENNIEVSDWTAGSSSQGENGIGGGCVVEVLVRKAQGGAGKGMSRSLEGLRSDKGRRLESIGWEDLDELKNLATSFTGDETNDNQQDEAKHPSQEHIPFNLSLTPAQQASRADVPVPYAHEGDDGLSAATGGGGGGGGKIVFEPGYEDDMDDDDPDEDLDF